MFAQKHEHYQKAKPQRVSSPGFRYINNNYSLYIFSFSHFYCYSSLNGNRQALKTLSALYFSLQAHHKYAMI